MMPNENNEESKWQKKSKRKKWKKLKICKGSLQLLNITIKNDLPNFHLTNQPSRLRRKKEFKTGIKNLIWLCRKLWKKFVKNLWIQHNKKTTQWCNQKNSYGLRHPILRILNFKRKILKWMQEMISWQASLTMIKMMCPSRINQKKLLWIKNWKNYRNKSALTLLKPLLNIGRKKQEVHSRKIQK